MRLYSQAERSKLSDNYFQIYDCNLTLSDKKEDESVVSCTAMLALLSINPRGLILDYTVSFQHSTEKMLNVLTLF